MALVAGLISTRLVVSTANALTRQTISDQADVIAGQSGVPLRRMLDILQGQGILVVQRRSGGALVGNPTAVRAARAAGIERVDPDNPVHATVEIDGDALLVEARAGEGNTAFALVRTVAVAKGAGRALIGNIIFALGVGLLVATAAGIFLARRLSRPLRRTADVAASMSHGRRDLRAPVEGPAEVALVSTSVNELADALHRSESRQRDFLLSVSHELRTPLTAVKGFAESLADGVVTGTEVPEVGRIVLAEANRLDRLVSDLLDLARLGADDFRLDLTQVDLAALLAEAADVWQARCTAAGVRFTVELPPVPLGAHTDPRRLRQVIDGLAENALRMTPAGRPIVLSLSAVPGAAVIGVRDGGPGLAPEEYAMAFDRGALHSRYAHSRPVGIGIGLALVHGLVTRMGGTIQAGPAPEGGAAFTVTMPSSSSPPGAR
ncbi:MAG TPA: HAMP domain-containing sensor histidine kinase [Actinophytocola sp.]|uniref:HAMP domain-containing sensor histidine kinase n=1 Tax=Actinophytocola sp. TaxID=1872138 RepID=UPI002DBCC158|nr:HAMP domain-containing sensor histidine kinase [Actinophytocola sp.]HEU5469705.1 HAMP domain-containing sensor histidine kinase [Actinophytocola sp.]